jgi:hypothetical protein
MRHVPTNRDGSGRYEIRVQGHLAARWAAWFDGFTLIPASDGTTVLDGIVVDQAPCTASCANSPTSACR